MAKKSFRILKFPFSLRDVRDIDNVTRACLTFHNMFLDFDNQFETVRGGDPTAVEQANRVNNVLFGQTRLLRARENEGVTPQLQCDAEHDDDDGYALKREKISKHLYYEYVHRNLVWYNIEPSL